MLYVSIPYRRNESILPDTSTINIVFAVSIPYRRNESPVACLVYGNVKPFQFLIGAMKGRGYGLTRLRRGLFQFLIGAMKVLIVKIFLNDGLEFQFLIGAMKDCGNKHEIKTSTFQFLIGAMKARHHRYI